jgi:hypothetical protein
MFNAFFCQRQYPEVLRSLENVCLNRMSKRDKKLGDSWDWGALFFSVWEGGATLTFHIFIAWTHKVCASKKAEEKPRKGNFLAIWGTQISKFPPGRA